MDSKPFFLQKSQMNNELLINDESSVTMCAAQSLKMWKSYVKIEVSPYEVFKLEVLVEAKDDEDWRIKVRAPEFSPSSSQN